MSSEKPPLTVVLTGVHPNALLTLNTILAFAKAGCTHIGLIGNSKAYLDKCEATINKEWHHVKVLTQEVDIKSPESVGIASHNIRSELGAWDVLVHSATPTLLNEAGDEIIEEPRTTVRGADEDVWWDAFEKNVRSLHHVARHFFSKMRTNSSFINILSANLTETDNDRMCAQNASQLAATRVVEYLGKENESSGLRVVNVIAAFDHVMAQHNLDFAQNAADFVLWCTSDEAAFINGRTVRCDVDELLLRKDQIVEDRKAFTIGLRVSSMD